LCPYGRVLPDRVMTARSQVPLRHRALGRAASGLSGTRSRRGSVGARTRRAGGSWPCGSPDFVQWVLQCDALPTWSRIQSPRPGFLSMLRRPTDWGVLSVRSCRGDHATCLILRNGLLLRTGRVAKTGQNWLVRCFGCQRSSIARRCRVFERLYRRLSLYPGS